LATLTLAVIAIACGGNSTASTTTQAASGATTAPEEKRATATEVAAGLRQIDATAKSVAAVAGTDKAKAASLAESIEPVWQGIEGSLKANDKDAYVTFEDTFAALKKAAEAGDPPKAARASADISAAVSAYLAKYPG
jgi:uncharacterized phage infection (PIP) family protein YhgE